MKKSIPLAAGLAVALLGSSCEKATVHPQTLALTSIQSAEETTDFYVSRDGEFHWSRQFVEAEKELKDCSLFFDGKSLASAPIESDTNEKPLLLFTTASPADFAVEITTAEGKALYTQYVVSGTTQLDLSSVALPELGLYRITIYQLEGEGELAQRKRVSITQGSFSAIYKA